MTNKTRALAFLDLIIAGNIRAAYAEYVASEFIHHNAYFKGDRESLMLAMEEAEKAHPGKLFEVKQALEDGDRVMTHSWLRMKPSDTGMAVVHIFRFNRDGRIVEFWDLAQPIPADLPNENGPF